ncbi:LIM zinc-binding domain-containing protein [Aphelenchoides fujianensis]|nr:LIM zinc-binding domain-containing protein [Aphelenchoides fujianensis]
MRHFSCTRCGCQLGGQKYVVRGERPHCVSCFQKVAGLVCSTEIPNDEPHITQGETHWHASTSCFSCATCGRNLLGKPYAFRAGALHCNDRGCERRKAKPSVPMRRHSPPRSAPPMRVRFDFRPPQPPPNRTPPLPPVQLNETPPENIYETVALVDQPSAVEMITPTAAHRSLPRSLAPNATAGGTATTSASGRARAATPTASRSPTRRFECARRAAEWAGGAAAATGDRSAWTGRRPASACTGRLDDPDETITCGRFDRLSVKASHKKQPAESAKRTPQNFYSRMPPEFDSTPRAGSSYATTSSESDSGRRNLPEHVPRRQVPNASRRRSPLRRPACRSKRPTRPAARAARLPPERPSAAHSTSTLERRRRRPPPNCFIS